MKIYYLINSRIPTEKAEGVEAFKLCEALADQAELVFVRPRRFNKIKADPFDFYDTKRNFRIVSLPVIDLVPFNFGHFGFWMEAGTFAVISAIYLLFFSKSKDIIYSHDQFSIFLPSFFRKRCYYDIHDFPRGKLGFYRQLFKNLAGITVTNHWKKDQLQKQFGISDKKIIAWPNGVELDRFGQVRDKTETREKLGLPKDRFLIGYVGMLTTMSMAKGIDIAIRSLKYLPIETILVLVGGRQEDVDYYRGFAQKEGLTERVIFVGWIKYERVSEYLSAFDVLIAPFPKTDHYDYYMSPMKIFEYMASGRPIVTSDLNSIREIMPDDCGIFVKPDSAFDLAEGIKEIITNPSAALIMATAAKKDVAKYTWPGRAAKIIELMSKI